MQLKVKELENLMNKAYRQGLHDGKNKDTSHELHVAVNKLAEKDKKIVELTAEIEAIRQQSCNEELHDINKELGKENARLNEEINRVKELLFKNGISPLTEDQKRRNIEKVMHI
jgi:hypothetical protein